MSLASFDPDDSPEYEAISYAWGQPVYTKPVRIGDSSEDTIMVTQNLDLTLRHLRYVDRPRTLWVDSICIDQSNDIERGAQVSMMGEIYRKAQRVVVFLGAEENHSRLAMKKIEDMGSQVEIDDGVFNLRPSERACDLTIGDATADLPCVEDELVSIYHLLSRSWFERLWVRQEILLATDTAVAVCGATQVPWTSFKKGLACIFLKGRKEFSYHNELTARLDVIRSLLFGKKGVALSTLRRDFGMLQCSDPRDRVYAMLEILRETHPRLHLQADYEKSVAEVFEDFASRYLSAYADLSILVACQLTESPTAPSWVPDWSNRVTARVETRIWSARLMFASGYLASLSPPVDRKLEVFGIVLGLIQELRHIRLNKPTTADVGTLVRDILQNKKLDDEYVGGGSRLESYVRTICLDAFADSFRPTLNHLPEFNSSMDIVRKLASAEASAVSTEVDDETRASFLSKAHISLNGRCLYELDTGYIGLGPNQIKPGDKVCVVLGSDLPMILRQAGKGNYFLVGTCYTCGVTGGEALLGPLPQNIRMIQTLVSESHGQEWRRTFVDTRSGSSSMFDPRLCGWPIDHAKYHEQVQKGLNISLKIEPEVLKAKNAYVQSFTLI
ncbi:heterokaryon incompatibility protein-domain-containing protein [Hypoxylon cercidicola]|nr:heterokaryon incompatibility protein-domain-containing protein [Hypoxylon cercidicola]